MKRENLTRRRLLGGIGAAAIVSSLPDLAAGQETADVIVIGAGISGLHAAMLLEEQGLSVIVLEGRARVGGRVYTLDDVDGRPEAGGAQVGPMHARVRNAVDQLGLTLYKPDPPWNRLSLALGSTLIKAEAWKDSPANTLPPNERALLPWQLERHYLNLKDPLTSLESWLTPEMAQYDVPLLDYFRGLGASDEALKLIALGNYAEDLRDISALGHLRYNHFLRTAYKEGTFDYVTGGMMRLPEAMAAKLERGVRFGERIVEIAQTPGGVSVRSASCARYTAKFALATVPFSTLRSIRLDPAPPVAQAEIIGALPYVQVTQVFLEVLRPYWEEDGLAPGLWTDGEIERVFPLGGADKEIGVLWVTINGGGDRALLGLTEEQTKARVLAEITRLRPAMKGKVRAAKVVSWSKDPFARGHLAYYAPGQIAKYKGAMAKAHGRLFFAGEHTAELAYGMEAAMESGERAALEILERG
jgi:monoamine oxidase